MHLILYAKPGCHLCEGLQEKLEQCLHQEDFAGVELVVRDITTREDWFAAYEYEIPVLTKEIEGKEQILPRPSPRTSPRQLEKLLRKYGF
ncbi:MULTISPECIES: glutaredoxin family protein [Spirulina sp. CCY15215]|uniref:glutaredoxin family protein n=1 Tax=Spirulina sp. CCY15215 TaxID=2767591 RepID=UPI00194F05A5|nr:glutaredoxin family protein [Spirulina major]